MLCHMNVLWTDLAFAYVGIESNDQSDGGGGAVLAKPRCCYSWDDEHGGCALDLASIRIVIILHEVLED